jgi:hypothetical protein
MAEELPVYLADNGFQCCFLALRENLLHVSASIGFFDFFFLLFFVTDGSTT